ncbi:CPBP family glutamic-type intramembrane protease [Chromobacterium sp. IIBBL 290-4]|uniref:CPBP family glutamic-type intramembrane protease n=1 Tax=Chromobacterium sp. IIBBL 290-4 TaxID=2953890 RepID=UPI0020B8B401|nr:CPBP family glutamic-type intramembrane protease [Chromobacterium sp. IIBBL 290-4]UTH73543.1 CPBP family glutamic-type intramembrane protease [Chromobacterium sp. IIBBL 290-4]
MTHRFLFSHSGLFYRNSWSLVFIAATILSAGSIILLATAIKWGWYIPGTSAWMMDRSAGSILLIEALLAPLLETLLFQLTPYRLTNKFSLKKWPRILVYTIPFTLCHLDSWSGVRALNALFCGIGLMWLFEDRAQAGTETDAFLATFSAHALHNAFVMLIVLLIWP